ncbi:hypothetical protein [Leptospira interrogans]|nr:hypothetical protein [Leptospira interrogans]
MASRIRPNFFTSNSRYFKETYKIRNINLIQNYRIETEVFALK